MKNSQAASLQQRKKPSESSEPRVLVSVLGYNAAGHTIETLRSLIKQTYTNYSLQLIDNASTNHSVEQIKREFPDLSIKVLPENAGYTGGNNAALKQGLAEGFDYILICNHDIAVDQQALEHLVEVAENKPDAGVVGCLEADVTGRVRATDGGKYCPWTSRLFFKKELVENNPLQVSSVHGAVVLFSRRALEAGVQMDEKLFMFFDEVDIGFQLHARGLSAYTDQRVIVKHKSDPYRLDEYVGYLSQRNRLYMVKKYGKTYHQLFYYLYATMVELPLKVIARTLQGHPKFAIACLLGHIDGLRGCMDSKRVLKYLERHAR